MPFSRVQLVSSLLAAFLLTTPAAAQAADAYVDGDTGSGVACTMGSPCATVANGIAAAGADDDVFVDGDTYNEQVSLDNGKSLLALEFAGAGTGLR
jgi:hypothetical protein